MIDKEIVQTFLHRYVGVVYRDIDKPIFSKGVIEKICDNSLILKYNGSSIILSFGCIDKIREIKRDGYDSIPDSRPDGN